MATRVTTVSTKGQLVIPSQMRSQLGIHAGTRVAIAVEGDHLILRPVSEKLVDEMKGILKGGGTSLSEELRKERRKSDRW